MPRLTSRKNGKWVVSTKLGNHKPIGMNPLYLFWRGVDRVVFGKDNGRNSW